MQLKIALRQAEAAEKAATACHMGRSEDSEGREAEQLGRKLEAAHKTIARLVAEVPPPPPHSFL
jgi:hypothetical protein